MVISKAKSGRKPEVSTKWSVQFHGEKPIILTFIGLKDKKYVREYLLRIRGEEKLPRGTLIWKGWK